MDEKSKYNNRVWIRWAHILLAIPIVGYFYGGFARFEFILLFIKFVSLPFMIVSGVWLWKGKTLLKSLSSQYSGNKVWDRKNGVKD